MTTRNTGIETTSGNDRTYFAVPEDTHDRPLALSSRHGKKRAKPDTSDCDYGSLLIAGDA